MESGVNSKTGYSLESDTRVERGGVPRQSPGEWWREQNENQNQNKNVEQNESSDEEESGETETESEEEQWTIDHKFLMFVNIYMYIFYACKRIFLFIEYDIDIIHLVLLFSISMPRSEKHHSH